MGKAKRKQNQLSKDDTKESSSQDDRSKILKKITMKDIEEMSSDEDDGEIPPEEMWGDDARNLKRAIESGTFDKLLTNIDDSDDFEEIEMNDDDDSNNKDGNDDDDDNDESGQSGESEIDDEDIDDDDEASDHEEEVGKETPVDDDDEEPSAISNGITIQNRGNQHNDTADINLKSNDDLNKDNNNVSTKAIRFVTDSLQAEKRGWAWAETFDILVPTPLPFGDTDELTDNQISVHDDLKREVAFYDVALAAVLDAKKKCKGAGIPFTRPDDFFAEMVKTDEHMARIKDRLIFETKKMDAVAQRKASKEQKLRSKEAQSNKLIEKAKRKKDHFKQLDDWAKSAAANRGRGGLPDKDEMFPSSRNSGNATPLQKGKKREIADKKYGFGGKRGRFKQNDPKELNNFSSFNPRGNFAGIGTKGSNVKKKGGAGANRQGKRARDAKRTR